MAANSPYSGTQSKPSRSGSFPEGEDYNRHVKRRQRTGKTWHGLFFAATLIGIIALAALILDVTNDAFGYILTRVDWGSFSRYDYVSRTCLGERTGEILIEEALKFVAETPVPLKLK